MDFVIVRSETRSLFLSDSENVTLCHYLRSCENGRMNSRQLLKRRMVADFVLAGAFGLIPPPCLVPISRNWTVMLTAFTFMLIGLGFWYDALRTLSQLRKPDSV
jgi:hypothetical protein